MYSIVYKVVEKWNVVVVILRHLLLKNLAFFFFGYKNYSFVGSVFGFDLT